MKEYRYGMRLRPFGIGCQPREGYVMVEKGTDKYYNIVVYNRQLTEKEIRDYELDELTDTIYQPRKGWYQKFVYHGKVTYNLYGEDCELIAEGLSPEE